MKRSPMDGIYYGWKVVAVLGVFSAMTVAMAGPNIAIFIAPMSRDLGWSPSAFGWAQFARLEAVIFAGPVIGRWLDRRGPRAPVVTVAAVGGALVLSLAYIRSEWQLVLVFLATGLLGMGRVVDLFVQAPVAKWFVWRRGQAMGLAMAGIPLGVAIFYPVSQLAIDTIGWRHAWQVFGVGGAFVVVPLAFAVLRRQPEDMGLTPDGEKAPPGEADRGAIKPERSFTRAQAMRTRSFWLFIAGFTAFTYGWSSLSMFRVPHFIERGLDPTLVALTISLDAVVAMAASVGLGRLLDKIRPYHIMLVGLAGLTCSAAAAIVVNNVFWLLVANIGYGFGFQTGHVALNVLWARRFGRRHLGEIQGAALPLTMGIGAMAFPVTGYIRQATGAYTPAWVGAIACFALAALLLLAARPGEIRDEMGVSWLAGTSATEEGN